MKSPEQRGDDPPGLAGRVIAVTRPREQARALAARLENVGVTPLLCPLLEISAASDPEPLRVAAAILKRYAIAVFVSPNAVCHALPTLRTHGDWPAATRAAAVGAGTAETLRENGVPLPLCPSDRFDSEGLLELPELSASNVKGRVIALFRGNGGRELLAKTLRERGATVDEISCYQRSGPTPETCAMLEAALESGSIDALTLSSSEALRHLLSAVRPGSGYERMLRLPLFSPHLRVSENARAAGFFRVVQTKAMDDGLLAGLRAYNWSR